MIETGLLCVGDQLEGLSSVRKLLSPEEFSEAAFETIPDENAVIRRTLRMWSSSKDLHLILTIGGSNIGIRERVPEVTQELLERPIPGLGELMRLAGVQKSRKAALWRGVAGQVARTLIVNLPAEDTNIALEAILPVLSKAVEGIRALEMAEKAGRNV
jgi:molybdopterin adenylyltransferase